VTRLVYLPGFDGTGELSIWLQRALPNHIDCEIVAYPTDIAQDHHTLADFMLSRLGRDPVVLIGESYSGPVAIEVAARAPDRIKGLILAGTFVTPPWPPWLIRLAARFDHRLAPPWSVRAVLLGRARQEDAAAILDHLHETLAPILVAQRLRALATVDARPWLPRVTCPILHLHGSRDWLVWPGPLTRSLDGRQYTVVKRLPAPHMVLQTEAEAAAREIVAFVGALVEPKT
jgi:pimeloyl-[acyl-carrier protein] methyl ester esterase